jgi:TolA-binding protein
MWVGMKALARSPLSLLGLFSLLFPVISGCATNSEAIEKKLSSLREEIQKLQNENDRMSERLEAIELRQAREEAESAEAKNAKEAPAVVTRPRLKVLHLSPESAPEEGPAPPASGAPGAKEEPRIMLKGQGKDLELRQGGG